MEKALNKGYNFASDFITIGGLYKKLCALKVKGVLVVGIWGLPLGSLETKNYLNVARVERCKVYYKGEGDGFPQVRAVVSLLCLSCPWLVLTPKMFQLCTNHFVLVLCKVVGMIEDCQIFLVPSWGSNMPLYLSIVLRVKEWASTPCSFVVFSLGLKFESFKELGVRHKA